MIKSWILLFFILVCILGCSSVRESFNAESPGMYPWAGGDIQLFFANPDYTTVDPLEKGQLLQTELYGGRRQSEIVHGGIGAMGIWRF